jgi:adenylate kinase family enzyme
VPLTQGERGVGVDAGVDATTRDPATSLDGCQRLIVLGASGSGKTTLAKALATLIDAPFVELDALNWGPNWTAVDTATFRSQVAAATGGECWVVDGGYASARDLLWPRADAIIWLDYPIWVNLWRLFWRACRRIRSKEELWNGNRESFRTNFLSRDSLFVWVVQTHRSRRRRYEQAFASPKYAALPVVRLRSPRATDRWLHTISRSR